MSTASPRSGARAVIVMARAVDADGLVAHPLSFSDTMSARVKTSGAASAARYGARSSGVEALFEHDSDAVTLLLLDGLT